MSLFWVGLVRMSIEAPTYWDVKPNGVERSGAVDRASDFGPRGPWFDSPPVHISLWS